MRTFIIIWADQLASTIGSYMTEFALTLWVWEMTGSATALALVGFFSQLPRIPITMVAGLIVDRFSRKQLMMLGDTIAALSTVGIGLLFLTESLQIWHLYGAVMLNGGFGQIQSLAYSTSVSSMVPPHQLTRANSMNSAVHYGSAIFGPALTGVLYPLIGLMGILLIDLVTFGVAIATLIAGPLADRVFEPAMQYQGYFAAFFSSIVGTGTGAGMALLYVITSIGLLLVGISGYAVPQLRDSECYEKK